MARTTVGAVESVLLRDYDRRRRPHLSPFIAAASVLVDKIVSVLADRDESLTDSQLEMIERWLAAHCYVMSDRTFAESRTEGAYAVFHGRTGMGLDFSSYGQMAKILDTTGVLASLDKRQSADMFWLGTPRGEECNSEGSEE